MEVPLSLKPVSQKKKLKCKFQQPVLSIQISKNQNPFDDEFKVNMLFDDKKRHRRTTAKQKLLQKQKLYYGQKYIFS